MGRLRGALAPLSSPSPSPFLERGIKGVRLTNNPFELFSPSRYNIDKNDTGDLDG